MSVYIVFLCTHRLYFLFQFSRKCIHIVVSVLWKIPLDVSFF